MIRPYPASENYDVYELRDDTMSEKCVKIRPNTAARWLINRVDRASGEVMTHLKLQKLLYYVQAWHLANFDRPLFDEDVQAWAHGPVFPSVYDHYRDHSWDPIPPQVEPEISSKYVLSLLQAVLDEYGQYNAKRLERLTHEEMPWRETRGDLPLEARCSRPIDKLKIRNFYAARIGKKEIKKLPH